MKIPSNKLWTQLNEGEVTGVLHETQNVALDTVGQLKLANRPIAIMSSDQDVNYSDTQAIVYFDSNYIAVTDDGLFTGGLTGNNWEQVVDYTPSTNGNSDAIVFNDRMVVTTNSQTTDWDGGVDDNYTLEALTAGVPHPMAIFDSNPTYKLAIGNGNSLKLLDTSYVNSSTTLTLASQFIITTLAYRSGYLYIGTKTDDGSEARIFIWNGSGSNAQYECPIGAEWVYSLIPYGGTVAAITNAGQLLQVSGSQAIPLAALPIYYAPHARWQQASASIPRVYHRGMVAVGQTIYINLEGELDSGFLPEMKSGVWVFDPEVGLYHRATSSTDTLVEDNGLSLSDSTITTSTTHNLKDGDAVQFRSIAALTGLDVNYLYYAKVITSTSIKLALTREAIVAEKYVTIGGTPGASDTLFYFPNTDNGSQECRAGAIALTTINETAKESLQAEVLWGSRSKNEVGTIVYTLNTFHDSNTVGSFTTQRIYTDNIEQVWKELYSFVDGIVTENDEVVMKVQTKHQPKYILLDGVWSATNKINTATTAQSSAWSDIEEGDELVLFDGKGQGKTVHVTEINPGALVYEITVDEDYGTVNSPIVFYRTSFKKLCVCNSTTKQNEFFKDSIMQYNKSPWIKIRCELRGAGTAVNMLELTNEKYK